MLNLGAAFDTVDHQTLLQRLERRFGITGLALAWFQSYLGTRKQTITSNGHFSSQSFDIKYGVPQGTVLGPLFFTLYSTPVADIIIKHELNFMIHSDDTRLYLTWMRGNYLVLNDNKIELMVSESTFE